MGTCINTSELISKRELLNVIRSIIEETKSNDNESENRHMGMLSGLVLSENIINNFLSVDATRVIRCNNCKYYTKSHRCGLTSYTVRSNDYCSYAETEMMTNKIEHLKMESESLRKEIAWLNIK